MSDGYRHDPDAFDEEGDRIVESDIEESRGHGGSGGDDVSGEHPDAVEREFDWRGWTLVAAIFVAFLVVPTIIYLYPRFPTLFGLSFLDAYLVLPMVPALVLGVLAVWATTRP
ncbi:uncharacterized protein NP_4818A [Natronomonas pharaonis DSM 2160]|uniref:Uncharacterized protein n=1 Tax=Natronomonas pharaonis (strain ATCC 35678 / DSM 2160 / CIP 103997 / JCM 8858 / NBRC 14720 / NCIMB 2260 / Gabara) TaxID=348780 RepID=A0A1U7EZ25_NATPD|nr:hypothetical protein [Natronomonas pharaonis]CAI50500.1 uncharacterized protein NP_4818A [Natronomonas pharaonis DSM 2160]